MKKAVINLLLVLVVVLQLIPLATMLLDSVRSNSAIASSLLAFPASLDFSNYVSAFIAGNLLQAFFNSVVINCGAIVIVVVVNILASYGLTRLNIYGKRFFTGYFLAAISVPSFGVIVPLYFAFNAMGLVNNKLGIILVYSAIFLPFTLLLMRSYFLGLPRELEEAAMIDGCSDLGALRRVTVPLAMPIITTVALIVFVHSYNEFLFANIFLQDDSQRTIALSFYNFVGKYTSDLGTIFAAACLTLLPIIALYFLLQRKLIEGLAEGGLKG